MKKMSCNTCSLISEFLDNFLQIYTEIDKFLQNSLYSIIINLNLINDLLDLANIEQSKFKLNQKFFDLKQVIQQSFDTVEFMAL